MEKKTEKPEEKKIEQEQKLSNQDTKADEQSVQEEKIEEEIVQPIEKSEEDLIKKAAMRLEEQRFKRLDSWQPKTNIGREVKEGKIKDIDDIFKQDRKIMEAEIVDKLLNLNSDLLAIGQAKGKFGGGKRRAWRQTQRKTAEGNQPSFACLSVVGNRAGYVGLGYGKAKETLPAREKAARNAKLNIIKITRGCGSFDCSCTEQHSIPFKVEGKCGSSKMILMPAPRGTGLVIEGECKKILAFAGIKDIYSKTFGQTRTKINLAKACFYALKKLRSKK